LKYSGPRWPVEISTKGIVGGEGRCCYK
jgi:hypothetical protein